MHPIGKQIFFGVTPLIWCFLILQYLNNKYGTSYRRDQAEYKGKKNSDKIYLMEADIVILLNIS
jgi:hypothetical protein